MQLQLSSSPRQVLRLLLWLRLCAVVGQSVTLAIVGSMLHVALPLAPMLVSIAVLAATAALSALRLRARWPATQCEIAAQLLLDIVQLTVMLYLSGGTTNPFASLYLVPIALAAVGLGWRHIGAIGLAAVCAYGWLISHFVPLDYPPALAARMSPMSASAFDLHMTGMQITFLLSCALLISALTSMAAEIRRRDRDAAVLRETALRDEHLSAMGILAAGAAHELSTPLLSMSLLVEELQCAPALDAQNREDLELLSRQVQLCKDKLGTLLQVARHSCLPALRSAPLHSLLQEALDQWRLIRPTVQLEVRWPPADHQAGRRASAGEAMLRVDAGFSQTLISLLDNAADASATAGSDQVVVTILEHAQSVEIAIDDEGAGLGEHLHAQAGKVIFTTKPEGFGLGLALSHAHLDRLKGQITLTARAGGGMRTLVTLPLAAAAQPMAATEILHG